MYSFRYALIACLIAGYAVAQDNVQGFTKSVGPAFPVAMPTSTTTRSADPTASAAGRSASGNEQGSANAGAPELRIGAGDLLTITVFGAPDFNLEVRVAEDGSVNLPLLGSVKAAGFSPTEFAKVLKTRLSEEHYFNDPQVSVFVKEYVSAAVSILGEVQKPGIYPLLGARTLFDVISAAQGITRFAGDRVTITHRDHPQAPEIIGLTSGQQGFPQNNVRVLPGDIVVVEKAGVAYVIGDVGKPSEILMVNPDLTVLQAIAMAEGTTPTAALNKAKIVRKTDTGQIEVPLMLKKMLSGETADVKLQRNDIVFVPGSAAKKTAKRSIDAALQTIVGMAVWGRF
jgi:polysaccharide export outer membrane protein